MLIFRSSFCIIFLLLVSLLSSYPSTIKSGNSNNIKNRRSVIGVKGGPQSVVWVVQLSDLHFSVFNPDRAQDFKRLVGPALAMINPSLVLITGDLTDGKSKDLLTMKQEEAEWIEYQTIMDDIIQKSGLDQKIFYDLRGNHDNFGVAEIGGAYDYYQKYSINSRLRRHGNVQSVTLLNNDWKHLFVGIDSTMEIGLRGPTNLFGHPTDNLLSDLESELSQYDHESAKSTLTKISFGHFPLSFSASTNSGRSLKSVFLKHSLSTYLCGHLHARFGKNLKRHHTASSSKYYQYNMHEGLLNNVNKENCSLKASSPREFWEWEMGDWRKSRAMRILAIDSGHVSFLDTDFKFGSRDTIILPTFPLDSRLMQRISYSYSYNCKRIEGSSYETIRALIFSTKLIISVDAKIYDSLPGSLSLVLESPMVKLEENGTRGDIYVTPWNWRAFVDRSPSRYWLQIEAVDMSGTTTYSQFRPISMNGLAYGGWKWKEFFVMGFQWASLYHPMLMMILALIFFFLLIPRAFLMYSNNIFTYMRVNPSFSGRCLRECIVDGAFWVLMELARMTIIWTGLVFYAIYLTFFPWFYGHIFTESKEMTYMNYKGWATNSGYTGVPDVMVIVIPHLCFVVLSSILVIAAMGSERTAYRTHFLSLSGKKDDDVLREAKKNVKSRSFCNAFCYSNWRWMRKILLLICIAILWKHWKQCRAVVKAYDMNPLLHAPIYCFGVPMLLAYAMHTTSEV